MIISPITFTLRDGRTAVLRCADPEKDAAVLIGIIHTLVTQTDFLLRYPDELDFTPEQERDFLAAKNASPRNILLLCEVDGNIAGDCSLDCTDVKKLRHHAEVGIGILRQYWGLGIGKEMMQALANCGRALDMHHLELNCISGNDRALRLYEKCGYKRVAVIPDYFLLADGTLHDNIVMQLPL